MSKGLTLYDEFSGAGGSSQGATAVPEVELIFAANHNELAIQSHAANFPNADHYIGDVVEADITRFPRADIFWASPACPPWTDARGVKRDFDKTNQQVLFGEDAPPEHIVRARALMEEVPRYLRYWAERGHPVLGGVVENVIQVDNWDQMGRWRSEIGSIGPGYDIYKVAYNSMHARGSRTRRAPQSRDRWFTLYLLKTFGRRPNLRKWLSPDAYCPSCDTTVLAMQVFKQPGVDMGRYGAQYVYRCPNTSCRGKVVEPYAMPALAAIDWSLPGTRIGDRERPLAPKTLDRIRAGLERYAVPVLAPAGGTWRNDAAPVVDPMPARTTRENDALVVPPFITELRGGSDARTIAEPFTTMATSGGHHGVIIPPLLVPVEGRNGKTAQPATDPHRTQTARNETGLAWLPFLAELRGGASDARSVMERMATITASGNHLFLCTPENPPAGMVMRNNTPRTGDGGYLSTPLDEPLRSVTTAGHQSLITWQHLLMPYYANGTARTVTRPLGALSTRDRYALVSSVEDISLDDVLFRMLEPHEIQAAMAFAPDYIVLGNKRDKVRQLGNAVTPPVAELLVSALVEAITGEDLERAA